MVVRGSPKTAQWAVMVRAMKDEDTLLGILATISNRLGEMHLEPHNYGGDLEEITSKLRDISEEMEKTNHHLEKMTRVFEAIHGEISGIVP